ncbi:hypothetical protein [Crocosphaera sp. Alani8]|uniref:hypothetical protein n=1 Tax=Crocosphaera sp. Alani8 TaxID=3038952 RepID=UPI00313C9B94
MVGSRDVGAEYVSLLLATILGGQGAYYVKQGLVKAWIGRHWFSWMLENRIECLIVNAYLRGWGACFWTKETIISIATYFSKIRLFVCSSIFLVEILSGFLMIHRSVAMGLLCALTIFHLGVFLLTGLLGYEFIINDLVMVWLLSFHSESFEGVFGLQYVLPTVFCALLGFAWVAFIRKRAIVEYQDTFTVDQSYGSLVDAVDLLMGWWDSPYMRMFTYTIVTKNGDLRRFPVTKMSPYDTAITDIHTHMMFLGSHQKLDPQVAEDRKIVCSGVWGLVIDIEKRDLMYALMDSMKVDLSFLRVKTPPKPWTIRSGNCQPDDAVPLWRFFRGINQYRKYWWFRTVMCWPHFPGEDLATDCNPLTQAEIPVYKFDEPIASVVIHRLKTFYTRRDIILLEHTKVGELIVSELSYSVSRTHEVHLTSASCPLPSASKR